MSLPTKDPLVALLASRHACLSHLHRPYCPHLARPHRHTLFPIIRMTASPSVVRLPVPILLSSPTFRSHGNLKLACKRASKSCLAQGLPAPVQLHLALPNVGSSLGVVSLASTIPRMQSLSNPTSVDPLKASLVRLREPKLMEFPIPLAFHTQTVLMQSAIINGSTLTAPSHLLVLAHGLFMLDAPLAFSLTCESLVLFFPSFLIDPSEEVLKRP